MNPQNVVRLRHQLVLVCCLNTSVLLDSDSATRLKPTGEIKMKRKGKKGSTNEKHQLQATPRRTGHESMAHGDQITEGERASSGWRIGGG
jgi:hypothetical protein